MTPRYSIVSRIAHRLPGGTLTDPSATSQGGYILNYGLGIVDRQTGIVRASFRGCRINCLKQATEIASILNSNAPTPIVVRRRRAMAV
jgi:hypothetical protein